MAQDPQDSQRPILPFELLEQVLRSVDDVNSLSSCALASHQLLALARSSRFSTIEITSSTNVDQVARFAQLLVDNDGLSSYVRSFSFSGFYNPKGEPRWHSVAVDPGNDLSTILSNIPNVARLQIKWPPFGMISWLWLSDDVRASLSNLLRQSSLQSVTLGGLDNLPPSLFNAVSFSSLSIHVCSFGTDFGDEKTKTSSIKTLHLRSSTVGETFMEPQIDFVLHPFTSICIQGLRQLYFRVRQLAKHPRIMDVLYQCRDTLEVLGFDLSVPFNLASFDGFNLSNFSRLKELRFAVSSFLEATIPPSKHSCAEFISTIYAQRPPRSFELLYFQLSMPDGIDRPTTSESPGPFVWMELDETITKLVKHMSDSGEVRIILRERQVRLMLLDPGTYFPTCIKTGKVKFLPYGEDGWFRE